MHIYIYAYVYVYGHIHFFIKLQTITFYDIKYSLNSYTDNFPILYMVGRL